MNAIVAPNLTPLMNPSCFITFFWFFTKLNLFSFKKESEFSLFFLTLGEYEPNDDECDWPSDEEDEELADDMKDKAKLEDEKAKKEEEEKDVKGVPEFWLTIFKNVDMLQEMVQEGDEPVLKKLQDITVTFSESPMVSYFYDFFSQKYSSNQIKTKQNFKFHHLILRFFSRVFG